ncbi:DUF5819 family protein [Streptomyces litchfieldiae]|uniref:DUF5819 family protein n=1 Tax=Streptomyces litchfieldiae TaxID=3075543 RepID=A0ABU2MLB7_9ACTN|nr:DUF5819 family protein [Streptomyces sp. DSM 44938]MDT0342222.1 DUF5819 family protein [Streptomyces sp. DSM 44938]
MLPSETAPEHAARDSHADTPTESVRLGALSLPARLVIALAVGGLASFAVWHLAMVFLFVSPSNTMREDHYETMRGYMYPEFEQNWKLFAPNPLQRDEAVHVRAEVRDPDGSSRVTEWIDLTAMDIEGIRHRLLPSHTAQNSLRRAWDFYTNSHDEDGDPVGLRGELSEEYVRRIAMLRLSDTLDVDTVQRIQLRAATTRVPAPDWRAEDFDTSTVYDELDWWVVTTDDLPGGALASGQEGDQR